MIGLVDCNNFFASCEELFRPHLRGKPIVVLSSNDGCVIARSKAAKKLGIAMGAPAFECRELFKKYDVEICSSNFTLYADMSRRVMDVLKSTVPSVEVYSIDEAFFTIEQPDSAEPIACGLRKKLFKWTGIPVSIGIARSKVLAKLASEEAKKLPSGVFVLHKEYEQAVLQKTPVEDIWGIGPQLSKKARAHGIYTAFDLVQLPQSSLQKLFNVVGQKIVYELRGESILELETVRAPRKSISTAKSFAYAIDNEEEIASILASYIARVTTELRNEGSLASIIQISLFSSNRETIFERSLALDEPTSYTPRLLEIGKRMLSALFNPNHTYRKVGVCLSGLVPDDPAPDFFRKEQTREHSVMEVVDRLNCKLGKGTIRFAAEKPRPVKNSACSRRATTAWDELPQVM